MPERELQGLRVLVTRPVAQARALSERIRQLGGQPIDLPLLEIHPLHPGQVPDRDLARVDLLIFVSANAVEYGLACLGMLPAGLPLAAIGQASAERLAHAGYHEVIRASQQDSEGFLALPLVQHLEGQRVMIVRGQGGREVLAEGLRARGALVEYLEVYQRRCPNWDADDLAMASAAEIIVLTSGEALENLARLAQLPGGGELRDKPLLVIHPRIAGRARDLGFTLKPIVTVSPGDEAVVACLLQWVTERKGTKLS